MKVGLVVYRGETKDFSSTGSNFYRYPHELYERTRHIHGLTVERIENYVPILGRGMSLMFGMALKDIGSYDIIHNLDVAPVFPLRRGKSIFVSTAHDFQFIFDRETNKSLRGRTRDLLWSEVILRLSARSLLSSDYLIAVSSLTKKDAIKLGYDKNKVFVVNLGVDERFFSPKPANRTGTDFVVGYLGVFAPRKDVPFAIRAFNKIDGKRFRFRIWGKKSYDYEVAVKAADGNRAIEFMGFAPDNKIVQIYDSLDAFVSPTTYEGFGIPIIEAMSRGLPVIIRKESKIPDEVRKYCFEAEDEVHMAQIIKNLKVNGYNDKLRREATAYARGFTWQRNAEQTIKAYKEILKRGA
jgi:glycosyltransferase involved in cell wall biosynthesis